MKDHNKRIWLYVEPPPVSPLIIDNLGITIPLKNLEGWERYKAARIELFGTNWLSRFWKGRVYPVLRPKHYDERKRRFLAMQKVMRQEFLEAVLRRADEAA